MRKLAFILPAHNEELNIPLMVERIEKLIPQFPQYELSVCFVDDYSTDGTPDVLREVADAKPFVNFVRLARNAGSHAALICGLSVCDCDAAILLASDGQDPPELSKDLCEEWENGKKVVWAARRKVKRSVSDRVFSPLYYSLMNNFSEIQMHGEGADMVLLDRKVIDILVQLNEKNSSLWAIISWLNFEQTTLLYDKQERIHGKSSWTFWMKLKAAIDSFVAFSYFPIRFMSCTGIILSGLSFVSALLYFLNKVSAGMIFGEVEVPGWTSIVVAIFFVSGLQMLMLGILGEYLWRTYDQIRNRPQYVIDYQYPSSSGGTT